MDRYDSLKQAYISQIGKMIRKHQMESIDEINGIAQGYDLFISVRRDLVIHFHNEHQIYLTLDGKHIILTYLNDGIEKGT
jgi:hypothetical protein